MKNMDTPPILAFSYQNDRAPSPKIKVKFKETPSNGLNFIYTPPKIGENGLNPHSCFIFEIFGETPGLGTIIIWKFKFLKSEPSWPPIT